MTAGRGGLSKADRRRAQDLELAGWIGGEFGLGTIDQVVRQWRDRGRLLTLGWNLVAATLVLGTWGLLVWLQSGDRWTREFVGVFIGGIAVLAVLLIALGERFKVMCCWYSCTPEGWRRWPAASRNDASCAGRRSRRSRSS